MENLPQKKEEANTLPDQAFSIPHAQIGICGAEAFVQPLSGTDDE